MAVAGGATAAVAVAAGRLESARGLMIRTPLRMVAGSSLVPKKGAVLARNHFSFEKRRKEVEKKKKKAAKREARAERKAAGNDESGAPIAALDEWGNAIPQEPENAAPEDEAPEDEGPAGAADEGSRDRNETG